MFVKQKFMLRNRNLLFLLILRSISCWEEGVNTTENLYLEGDDLKVLKLLRETYLDGIIASVTTLYIRSTLLRTQMSILLTVCSVMRRLITKSLHCTETTLQLRDTW